MALLNLTPDIQIGKLKKDFNHETGLHIKFIDDCEMDDNTELRNILRNKYKDTRSGFRTIRSYGKLYEYYSSSLYNCYAFYQNAIAGEIIYDIYLDFKVWHQHYYLNNEGTK